jgi:glycosyltransferase 2 family protein
MMPHALDPISCAQTRHEPRFRVHARAKLIFLVRWLVTVLALWLVLRTIDLATVLDLIGRAAPPALGLAGLVVAAQFVARVWRWQLVIRMLKAGVVNIRSLSVFLAHSFVVGQLLPSSIGGDVARTLMLTPLTGAAAAVRSVVCDRLLGFAGFAILIVPALPIIAGKMGGLTPFVTLTIVMLGIMGAVALILISPSLVRAVPWLGHPLAIMADDLRLTLGSGRVSLVAVALSVGANLLCVLLIYIFGVAIGVYLRAFDCLLLVPPALFVSTLPISLGGWGVREGALLAAFSLVQANPAGVAATSVMFGMITLLEGVVVSGASLLAGWRDILLKGSRNV